MNYLAIIVCAIAAMVIGSVWYGPFFGKAWMRIASIEAVTPEQKESIKKGMWMMYMLQFILSLITAYMLSYFVYNWAGSATALGIALAAWLGFVITTSAGAAMWSGKPKNIALQMFLISAGAQLVTFIAFGIIIGMMTRM